MNISNPKIQVDHKSRDTLDNRKQNLRLVTQQQNQFNRSPYSKTGFKGVAETPSGKYEARMFDHGKYCYLGLYDSPEEAARVVDKFIIEKHGEFGCLNFPQ